MRECIETDCVNETDTYLVTVGAMYPFCIDHGEEIIKRFCKSAIDIERSHILVTYPVEEWLRKNQ